jgi:hypothetical protein
MKWVKASEFKADCVGVAEEASAGDPVLVVKSGRARGVFFRAKPKRHAYFGMDKGKIRILGDIVSPMHDAWEWTSGRDAHRK